MGETMMKEKKHLRYIDPEPIFISLGIITATAAVVGMIDVIRRARRQERIDREEAERREREERRLDREEQRQIREEERREREFERDKKRLAQRHELKRIDALLEMVEDRVAEISKILEEEAEMIPHTNRFLLPERTFYRYRERTLGLVELIPRINDRVMEIEPTLGPVETNIPDFERIEDDLEFDEEDVLRQMDTTWLQGPLSRIYGKRIRRIKPFEALVLQVALARKRIDAILQDDSTVKKE
jgi:hypothetical protein